MSNWALKDAREACETVFERACGGEPQLILHNQQPMVVVISYSQYVATQPKVKGNGHSLLKTLMSCPCPSDEIAAAIEDRKSDLPSYFEQAGGFGEN